MRPRIRLGEHFGAIGSTGSGKTTYFRRVMLPPHRRLLITDTKGTDFRDFPKVVRPGGQLAEAIPLDEDFRWRVSPPRGRAARIEWIDDLAQGLLDRGEDGDPLNLVLYVDESTDFSDAYFISEGLEELVRKARAFGMSLYWGTQRPPGANRWLRDNSVHLQFFYVREQDRKALEQYWPGIGEQLAQVSWGSFRSIYVGPDGVPHLMERA